MMSKVGLASLLLLVVPFAAGCESKVALQSENDERTLTYSCGNFEHQVEQLEDVKILMHNAKEVSDKMREQGKMVSAKSLIHAIQNDDFRRVEELIVEFKCGEEQKGSWWTQLWD